MNIRRPLCLVCIVFLCVVYLFMKGKPPSPSWDVDALNGRTLSVSGKITDRQIKNGVLNIYLKNVHIERNAFLTGADKADFPQKVNGIVVKIPDYENIVDFVRLGARIEARGVFAPFDKPMNEGQFDARSYYMIRGYEGQIKRAHITGVSKGYSRFAEKLREIRDMAESVIDENMSAEDAGLLAAITLGDKTGLDTEIKELYQNAGISHVLALSGLHIASVGLCLLKILRKIGVRLGIAAALSGGLIVVYGIMTGLSTSTLRAMIMFGLAVIAMIIGRTYDLLSAAALSAILIVAENPGYLFDSGFLLSFGAVVAIGVVFPVVEGLVRDMGRDMGTEIVSLPGHYLRPHVPQSPSPHPALSRLPKYLETLRQGICVSISVTIVTLPVMASSFFQISRYSILLNLVIIPLMGVVLATGFAGICLGMIANALNAGFLRACTGGVFKITEVILWLYQKLGELTTNLSSNLSLFGKPEKWQIVIYVTLVIVATVIGNKAISEKEKRRENHDDVETRLDRGNNRTSSHVLAVLSLTLFLVGILLLKYHPTQAIEIRNIFVGQGDCAVISGKNVPVILIDGGSSDVKSVGKYRILPVLKSNAISQIDYCFLTHLDNDHVSGIIEILEDPNCGVRIRNVVIPACDFSQSEVENINRLREAVTSSGAKLITVSAGNSFKIDNLYIHCLNPGKGKAYDGNDSSIVLAIKHVPSDFDMLFTGDASSETEAQILAQLPEDSCLLNCDFLKVAHHGSKNSTSEEFLKRATPKLAVISAGIDNSYGHPHKETLERLNNIGTKIYCTAEEGEVITKIGSECEIETWGRR